MNDFEKNIREIETIISKIEKGEINLAQLADEVENAKKIINLCKDELKNIQSKVESLVNNE
ncbi:MAG: exodeoxyribonuclease VII small subunit [Paludibacteraceae bacterium]|nr:exodeoxyribonuclease VII small subunit [Paludibacteraceae bacterium]MBR3871974.1 exodeoxyribonuclease VII small subunit [Paludibacteraceae bacterium]MBR6687068.1 exodeoxyribonuclease VII small subunit [Paludibacteraceae bacterium]